MRFSQDPLYANAIAFDIVTEKELTTNNPNSKDREIISFQPNGERVKQPPYNFGTTQIQVNLKVGVDYYIVPSLHKRNQSGVFYLNVYGDVKSFFLEGATILAEAQKPMVIGKKDENEKVLKMSVSQFYEKKEILRERIIAEAKRLNLSISQIAQIFSNCKEDKLLLPAFKKKMMELGFQLADFPDDDLVVFDLDNDGTISPAEFIKFMRPDEINSNSDSNTSVANLSPPEKPIDDLLYKAIDMSGELNLQISSGRSIREPGSWINNANSSSGTNGSSNSCNEFIVRKGLIKYSLEEALIARQKSASHRLKLMTDLTASTQPKRIPELSTKPSEEKNRSGKSPLHQPTENLKLDSTLTPRALASSLRGSETLQSLHTTIKGAAANTVLSEISQSQSEAVRQAGTSAGAKLHSDSLLQRAELSRTKYLSSLRSYSKRNQDDSEVNEKNKNEGILRRKNVTSGKIKNRDFSKDLDAQILLNYFPTKGKVSSNDEKIYHHYAAYYDELPDTRGVDLWDYLIDCVVTIVDSRSNAFQSSQYDTYISMKKRKGITTALLTQLNPDSGIATNVPTPLRSKNGQMTAKQTKGHTPTPRSQRRIPGTVSVTTIQTKTQQRNSLIDAKEKLQDHQREQGVVYEEVYRRVVAVPTIEEHDLYGEKKAEPKVALGGSEQNRGFPNLASLSPAVTANLNQIYLLFLKFDRNLNGTISKQEFQLVFKELKIEFSNQDCDIFFNRFSSLKSADNIDWKEFLNFFQRRVLLSESPEMQPEVEETSISNDFLFANNESNDSMNRIVSLLLKIQHIFRDVFAIMVRDGIYSIDKLLMNKESVDSLLSVHTPQKNQKTSKEIDQKLPEQSAEKKDGRNVISEEKKSISNTAIQIPNNAIFQSLTNSQAKQNTTILKSFGLKMITNEDMCRVNRIFNYDLNSFMSFVKDVQFGSKGDPSFQEIVNYCDLIIAKELTNRIGIPIIRPFCQSQEKPAVPAPREKEEKPKAAEKVVLLQGNKEQTATTGDNQTIRVGNAVIPVSSLRQDQENATKQVGSVATNTGTLKIWNCLTSNKDPFISYDVVLNYFQNLLEQSHYFKSLGLSKEKTVSKVAESKDTSSARKEEKEIPTVSEGPHMKKLFYGVDISILLRLVIDSIISSDWNRPHFSTGVTSSSNGTVAISNGLSFSGLDAYVRYSNIQKIERKLKYLLLLEKNLSSSFTYLLVHVCLNPTNNEVIVICHDPVTNEIYKLQCKEEIQVSNSANVHAAQANKPTTAVASASPMKDLPTGEKIKQAIVDYYSMIHLEAGTNKQSLYWGKNSFFNNPSASSVLINDSFYLYNPVETPLEDKVIQDFVNRIKLIRRPLIHGKPSELILSENPALVKQMKDLLDSYSEKLSFFYILNDLSLRFEINSQQLIHSKEEDPRSSNALVKTPSAKILFEKENNKMLNIRHVIFNQIRSLKNLHSFLVSIKSSLTIILSTYNSTLREVMNYEEFLLHLLNYRNCFLTVKLLPEFIKPSQYLYEPPTADNKSVLEQDSNFNNTEEDDDEDQQTEESQIDKSKYKSYYVSNIDYDGLPHPKFDEVFSFFYKQSKLTSCQIVTTEVVKMNIDEIKKFVMIQVREGKRKAPFSSSGKGAQSSAKAEKEPFWFLTLYDPRTATEYQCGVKEESELFKQLYYHKANNSKSTERSAKEFQNLEKLNENLRKASELNQLILGPAITPRLEFQLYNYKDSKLQELIGECQISISAVLSNSGVGEKLWSSLIYKMEKIDSSTGTGQSGSSALEGKKKVMNLPAGELEIELSFRRSLEIESDSLLLEKKKSSKSKSALASRVVSALPSARRGDEDIPPLKVQPSQVAAVDDKELAKLKNRVEQLEKDKEELTKKLKAIPSPRPNNVVPSNSGEAIHALERKIQELETSNAKISDENKGFIAEIAQLNQKLRAATTKDVVKVHEKADDSLLNDLKVLKSLNTSLTAEVEKLKNQSREERPVVQPPPATDLSDFLVVSPATVLAASLKSASFDTTDSLTNLNMTPVIHQILHFLYKKYEKKQLLKFSGGAALNDGVSTVSFTEKMVLENLSKLLHASANGEGYVHSKTLLDIFLEFQVYVELEIFTKIVSSILGNNNNMSARDNKRTQNMIQVHQFVDYLEKELVQVIKQNSLSASHSKGKLRNSVDFSKMNSNSHNNTLVSADDEFVKHSFSKGNEKAKKKSLAATAPGRPISAAAAVFAEKKDEQKPNNQAKDTKSEDRIEKTKKGMQVPEGKSDTSLNMKDEPADRKATIPIDWSKEPLPENWERRFHTQRKRVSFLFLFFLFLRFLFV
jgi:Ca2+-binding EF-hand superfamily protein